MSEDFQYECMGIWNVISKINNEIIMLLVLSRWVSLTETNLLKKNNNALISSNNLRFFNLLFV